VAANLFAFEQQPFVTRDAASIGSVGYVYIPTSCQNGKQAAAASCRVHVSFHGCEQNLALVGNEYSQHAGFNEWAEVVIHIVSSALYSFLYFISLIRLGE